MKKEELVFIPSPGAGHLGPALEMAKHLVAEDSRISITILLIKLFSNPKIDKSVDTLISTAVSDSIRFIKLPYEAQNDLNVKLDIISPIEKQKPLVEETISKLIRSQSSDSTRLAGFVLDMFCGCMIEVADKFGVPSYMFFTSGAASLGFQFYIKSLFEEHNFDSTKFNPKSDDTLDVPSFMNHLPVKVLPSVVFNMELLETFFLRFIRTFKGFKGIIVNTFMELESHAIHSLSCWKSPQVYPIGPMLNLGGPGHDSQSESESESMIINWLDGQPPSSVVFLCFGSMGSFGVEQVKEIAHALELTCHRFLWSLRQPPPKGKREPPTNYTNLQDVLPEGFLDRTNKFGKVIGWAPQVAILGHLAVGGFVSHCGWNSILESLWFGVPIATWPLYAEQQLNAFQLVTDLGLAVEIKMDYVKKMFVDEESGDEILSAEVIERGIRCLMEVDSQVRKKVKIMSEMSRKALLDGGSSCTWLRRLIADLTNNTQ